MDFWPKTPLFAKTQKILQIGPLDAEIFTKNDFLNPEKWANLPKHFANLPKSFSFQLFSNLNKSTLNIFHLTNKYI
uniref:Uncharacterized protein n=1 Tax=Rhizophagus irregularis (strain DAOM 181602 / DAOM 197198 / MUCL 43194) TaxID=747089 RepID=U9SZT6_RHIID